MVGITCRLGNRYPSIALRLMAYRMIVITSVTKPPSANSKERVPMLLDIAR